MNAVEKSLFSIGSTSLYVHISQRMQARALQYPVSDRIQQ